MDGALCASSSETHLASSSETLNRGYSVHDIFKLLGEAVFLDDLAKRS